MIELEQNGQSRPQVIAGGQFIEAVLPIPNLSFPYLNDNIDSM
ncbi:MAG: hypothetical protein ACU84H_16090 [Gammaproteobacteria bacterium]